jgi:predicted metal-binding membrane protein
VSGDNSSPTAFILRHDRLVGLVVLCFFIALAWWYLLSGAGMPGDMPSMAGMDMDMEMPMDMNMTQQWTPGYAALVFIMWWVMMIAMMLPSATPMILLYGLMNRRQASRGSASVSSAIFAFGYLTVWGAFSLAATMLQWQLERLALMSPAMVTTNAVLGGLVLVGAGVYQLTPFRDACLQSCRGPVDFFARFWSPGAAGAWKMGMRHGLFCLGCCWMLMALLFYGGVMNLYWIIGLALYVLVERFIAWSRPVSRIASAVLILWGVFVLAGAMGLHKVL